MSGRARRRADARIAQGIVGALLFGISRGLLVGPPMMGDLVDPPPGYTPPPREPSTAEVIDEPPTRPEGTK